MATVTAAVTLQYSPGSGNYPTSGAGYAAVSAYAGDTLSITVTPQPLVNSGHTLQGNEFITSTSATSISAGTFYYTYNQTVTITGIARSGNVSFWCGPNTEGNSVPYRARVAVTLLTPNQSISISGSNSVSPSDTATVTWARTPGGTYYYNSTGNATHPRALPRSGSLSGTGGSFGITYQAFASGSGNSASRNIEYTLRETNTGGNELARSNEVFIYRVPVAPTDLSFTTTTSSITATASGGTYGVLQVSIDNTNWFSSPFTFQSLDHSTSYTIYARRYNVVTPSSVYTETATTDAPAATAAAPTLNPSVTLGNGGFYIYANPGTSTGTLEYVFTSGSTTVNRGTNSFLGVGAATWEGSTWTITVTATEGSTTDTSSASITLPTFTSFTATNAQQGVDSGASITVTNLPTAQTVYYATSGAINTSFTAVSVSSNSDGSAKTNTFDIGTGGGSTGTTNVVLDVSTFGSAEDEVANTSFQITSAGSGVVAPNAPNVSDDEADSANVTVTAVTTSGSGGTLQYGRTLHSTNQPNSWQTSGVFPATPRSDSSGNQLTYYYWARRSTTAVSSNGTEYSPGYKSTTPQDNSLTIGTLNPTSPLAVSHTGSVSIPYTGGADGDQYRIVSNDTGTFWLNTKNNASNTFTLSNATKAAGGSGLNSLPDSGETFTYFIQGRRIASGGGPLNQPESTFVTLSNTPNITITRGGGVAYSFINTPSSVTEGNILSFSIEETAGTLPNGGTVPYTISGIDANDISSGSLTGNLTKTSGSFNTIEIELSTDSTTENDTAVITLGPEDSEENATSTQTSVTIVDSTTGTGPDTTPGGSGFYGLEIYNQNENKIIEPSSRVGTFIASALFNSATASSQVFFTDYGVLDRTEFGLITTWSLGNGNGASMSPYIIRRSAEDGGGILVTRVSNHSLYHGTLSISLLRF